MNHTYSDLKEKETFLTEGDAATQGVLEVIKESEAKKPTGIIRMQCELKVFPTNDNKEHAKNACTMRAEKCGKH